jgi:hypothetical protein
MDGDDMGAGFLRQGSVAMVVLAAPLVVLGIWLGCSIDGFGAARASQESVSGCALAVALVLLAGSAGRGGWVAGTVIQGCGLLLAAADASSWVLQGSSFNERFFAHLELANLAAGAQAYPWAIGVGLAGWLGLTGLAIPVLSRVRRTTPLLVALVPAAALLALACLIDAPPRRLADYVRQATDEQALAGTVAGRDLAALLAVPSRPDAIRATPGRNLVFVYLESVERTYTDARRFPGLTPNIDRLRAAGLDFSGFRSYAGATYTIAGIFASQCGAPFLEDSVFGADIGKLGWVPGNDNTTAASFHPQVACLGDVLHAAGYRQTFLSGAPLGFTNKGEFFRLHGYDTVLGESEIEQRHGGSLPTRGWGLVDRDVFGEALATFRHEEASGKPFSVVLETADTHPPSGYLLKGCEPYAAISNPMLDAVHCTDRLLGRFVDTLAREPGWNDTVVVVMSDHLAMRNAASPLYPPLDQRQPLLFVVNAGRGDRPARLLHMDIAPTVLALAGVRHDDRFMAGADRSAPTAAPARLPDTAVAHAVLRRALWEGRPPPVLCRGDALLRWNGDGGFDVGGWSLPLMKGGFPLDALTDDDVLLLFVDARGAQLQVMIAGNEDRWLDKARKEGRSVFLAAPFRDAGGAKHLALDWLAPGGAWASLGAVPDVQAIKLASPRCGTLLDRVARATPGARLDFGRAFATVPVPAADERRPGRVAVAAVPADGTPETNAMFMYARIEAGRSGLSPFRITEDRRIFMHPVSDRDTWAEFDVSGIAALDLAPRINPLRGGCSTREDTGVIGLWVSLDGKPVGTRIVVNRDYQGIVPVAVNGARRLRIDIDDGNGTEACDWFSLGFPVLAGIAAPARSTPAAMSEPRSIGSSGHVSPTLPNKPARRDDVGERAGGYGSD